MAKISARGCHEVARVRMDRPSTERPNEFTRETRVLRSDGAVLSKVQWYKDGTLDHATAYGVVRKLQRFPQDAEAQAERARIWIAAWQRLGFRAVNARIEVAESAVPAAMIEPTPSGEDTDGTADHDELARREAEGA